ncbi:MAG: phosphodiesterase, family [Clostridiales bacterium]|jgi:putative phosphoesterase|nr:phosphodiesterase, family [Clostridiales bacterium]
MKILVISDTHGKINPIVEFIRKDSEIRRIIHLGDIERDVDDLRYIFPEIEIEAVSGNNDFFTTTPQEKIIDIAGIKTFITHGHKYSVKSTYTNVKERGISLSAGLVLFGHTHIRYYKREENITLINPGSATLPSDGKRSCTVIEIDKYGEAHFTMCYL